MASEASAAQCKEMAEESKSLPIAHSLLQETALAGFLGHVQLAFARVADAQGWKKVEQQLESVSLTASS